MKPKTLGVKQNYGRIPSKTTKPVTENDELAALVKTMFHHKVNRALLHKNARLSAKLRKILTAASPESKLDLVSGIAVDLADFWEIGEEHQRRVKKLLNMRFPKDKKHLEDMLYEFDVHLVIHAEWHAKHLKKLLKKFRQDLSK
jgi:hypothetical protein